MLTKDQNNYIYMFEDVLGWYGENGYLLDSDKVKAVKREFMLSVQNNTPMPKEILVVELDKTIKGIKLTNTDLQFFIEPLNMWLENSRNIDEDLVNHIKNYFMRKVESADLKSQLKKEKSGFTSNDKFIDYLFNLGKKLLVSILNKENLDTTQISNKTSKDKIKLYMSKIEKKIIMDDKHLNLLVNELIKSKSVNIKFLKTNGEVREMNATRNSEYADFQQANYLVNLKNELVSGTLRVYDLDLNAMKSFPIDTLLSFKVESGVKYVVTDGEINSTQNMEKYLELKRQKTLNKKIVSLENNVIRFLVKTKEDKIQAIYGTLNEELISVYSKDVKSDLEKLKVRTKNNISIYDLKKREVGYIDVKTLEGFDIETNTKGWLEFEIESDGWYALMLGLIKPSDVLDKEGNVKKTKANTIESRVDFEVNQVRELAKKGILSVNYKKEIMEEKVYNLLKREEITNRFIGLNELLKDGEIGNDKISTIIENDAINIYKTYKNRDISSTEITRLNNGIVRIAFSNGEKLIFHNNFIINSVSNKKYYTNLKGVEKNPDGLAELPFVSELDKDVELIELIDNIIYQINNVNYKNTTQTTKKLYYTERDKERIVRLNSNLSARARNFVELGLMAKIGVHNTLNSLELVVNKQMFIINPIYIFHANTNTYIYVKEQSDVSALSVVEDGLELIKKFGITKEQYDLVNNVLISAFDLRRTKL